LILLAIFVGITKIGLAQETALWNVPGIPISGLQLFTVVVVIGLGLCLFSSENPPSPLRGLAKVSRFLPFLIFLGAVFAWGLTPMRGSANSLPPTSPNYQPFPTRDARIDDIGGISILKGEGINFHGFTDKPLHMVFLAFLHLFAGYDYSLLTWLQVIVLALIPVILFFFGKNFLGSGFGVFLALVTILRQRNAIVLSSIIDSVNPKLLLTEVLTLLVIVLFAYLVFLWFRNKRPWLALLCGGVVGAASLVRLNPVFLFPAIACLALVALWNLGKSKWKHLTFFVIGFLILVIPWMVTGVDPNGVPWSYLKVTSVIHSRYKEEIQPVIATNPSLTITTTPIISTLEFTNPSNSASSIQTPMPQSNLVITPGLTPAPFFPETTTQQKSSFSSLFINHFFHNFSASLLALPDALNYDDLNHLSQREYWVPGNPWPGNFSAGQILSIFINLVLLAIGLGYSWSRYRWAGLVPLVIFISYDISLGFAFTSGGRYIVPIDWVLYFYYGVAIVVFIQKAIIFFQGKQKDTSSQLKNTPNRPFSEHRKFWISFTVLAIAASLIPVTNLVLPAIASVPENQSIVDSLMQSILADQKPGSTIVYGEILYPYYDSNGVLYFDLLTDKKVNYNYSIVLNVPLKMNLYGGEQAFVITRYENKKILVESIYLLVGSSAEKIWELSSALP